jgi:serine/threonine protein kinase
MNDDNDETISRMSTDSHPVRHPAPRHIATQPIENSGAMIGRYKILQPLGEGGCGVVYMAEQEEPVRRRVALKVIKLGMDTKQVVARFEAERQALALMDHPNIAKVLDGGATESGRPYFVMELVRGVKITEYADDKKLTTRQRLELFIAVCQAVQHAHHKGIIHRDLKPSNILVTERDGAAVPKVIDFGIAKATDQRLTDSTLFTAVEQFIGTPAFMSPEQAGLGGLDIDTRSDIYSLGVLLYELLTGQPLFAASELNRSNIDEIRRTIREREPVRPSLRITSLTELELTNVANLRGSDSARLSSAMRGDLDWIVMKALEKDRSRRYETANALATDIRRSLDNEPVMARPPSQLYRFQKMVRRNKVAVAATGGVIAALAIGFGVSTWALLKEREARRDQVAALNRLNDVLKGDGNFSTAVSEQAERLRVLRARLPSDDPAVADAIAEMAWTLLISGNHAPAEPLAREWLAIHEKGKSDDFRTGWIQGMLGESLARQKRYGEAEPLLLAGYANMKAQEDRIPAGWRGLFLGETLGRLELYYTLTDRPFEATKWKLMRQEFETAEARKP